MKNPETQEVSRREKIFGIRVLSKGDFGLLKAQF